MPTTVNRGYSVPTTGSESGTWGSVSLNPNFETIDTNIGGVTTFATTGGNTTLTSAQYANGTIRITGALVSNASVTFPAVQGWWTIDNQTTGSFAVTLTTASATKVIATPQGAATDVFIDGTNVGFRNLPPIGSYMHLATSSEPPWIAACTVKPWLICDGSAFSALTYPYLATQLGGTTLPSGAGRIIASLNQGTGRITTEGSGIDGNTLLASGGAQTVLIAQANFPTSQTNSLQTSAGINYNTLNGTISAGSTPVVSSIQVSGTQSSQSTNFQVGPLSLQGSNTPLNKMPPTLMAGILFIRAG